MNDEQRVQIERMADRLSHDCAELSRAARTMSEGCVSVAMDDVVHAFRKLLEAFGGQ